MKIPYDDYNSKIIRGGQMGTITQTCEHSALKNGQKIIEIYEDTDKY